MNAVKVGIYSLEHVSCIGRKITVAGSAYYFEVIKTVLYAESFLHCAALQLDHSADTGHSAWHDVLAVQDSTRSNILTGMHIECDFWHSLVFL